MTGFHVHRGCAGLAPPRTDGIAVDELPRAASSLVVLRTIVDHANVGAILRNAAALGLTAPCRRRGRPIRSYRRSIKVSMGAVFSLPWARLRDWRGAPEMLAACRLSSRSRRPGAGGPRARDELAAAGIDAATRLAVHAGHPEGAGLSRHWVGWRRHERARIPMFAGIDSLQRRRRRGDRLLARCSAPGRHRPNPPDRGPPRPAVQRSRASCELCPASRSPNTDAIEMVGLVLQSAEPADQSRRHHRRVRRRSADPWPRQIAWIRLEPAHRTGAPGKDMAAPSSEACSFAPSCPPAVTDLGVAHSTPTRLDLVIVRAVVVTNTARSTPYLRAASPDTFLPRTSSRTCCVAGRVARHRMQ